jgi:hypothetical protein
MSAHHVRRIWRFVRFHREHVGAFVVHCHQRRGMNGDAARIGERGMNGDCAKQACERRRMSCDRHTTETSL